MLPLFIQVSNIIKTLKIEKKYGLERAHEINMNIKFGVLVLKDCLNGCIPKNVFVNLNIILGWLLQSIIDNLN